MKPKPKPRPWSRRAPVPGPATSRTLCLENTIWAEILALSGGRNFHDAIRRLVEIARGDRRTSGTTE